MEGLERDWNYVRTRNFVTYTNLPPGEYIFKVKGCNSYGVWNEEGTSLKITITPPFWQTWWFRGSGVIVILFLIFAGHQIRTHTIRERNKQLERRVEERTIELEAANREAQRRAAQAALIYKVGQRVSSKLELKALLSEIVNAIREAFNYYSVALLLHDEGADRLTLQSSVSDYIDLFPKGLSLAIGEGIIGYAAASGKTQASGDVSKDPHFVRKATEETKSELAIPIKSGERIIGVLDIQSNQFDAFHETEVTAMETLSTQIATAIENARLYETVQRELAERMKAEKKLQRSNEELQQFAYIASHDLQEPLRKVQAFGDRLQAKYREVLGENGRDYLERMQNATQRMQNLINNLLMYSRVTTKAQPFVPVDLAQVVQEVLSDLETRIEQTGGRVEVGALPTIEADPMQMRQLLQNLIGNALKFHRQEETPLVKVYEQVLTNQASANGFCHLLVEDNGIGFEEKYAERIFGLFQRLYGRDQYEGTGIGLAICRKIVERHGGNITAKSTPGQGSTFIVTLPIKQDITSRRFKTFGRLELSLEHKED